MEQLPLKFSFDTAESIPDAALSVEQYKDGMRRLAQPAINAMRLLLENPNTPPHVLASVAQAVIHAAFGKPAQELQHTGADGEPLQTIIREIVRPANDRA